MKKSQLAHLVRARVRANPLQAYAAVLGCGEGELRKNGEEHYALAPCHDDRDPSLRIHPQKATRYCDPCRAGGDIFTLWAIRHGLDCQKEFGRVVEGVAALLELQARPGLREVAVYDYRDETRTPFPQVYEEPKDFRQRRPDGRRGREPRGGVV